MLLAVEVVSPADAEFGRLVMVLASVVGVVVVTGTVPFLGRLVVSVGMGTGTDVSGVVVAFELPVGDVPDSDVAVSVVCDVGTVTVPLVGG